MTDHATMRAELRSVLADPAFARSPVLARLLTYLVETTLRGGGQNLKSYSIAIDGLGRSAHLDPQGDTYARVQVVRLRKALDTFYAGAGVEHGRRLTIDNGSYEVKLADNGYRSTTRMPASPSRIAFANPFAKALLAMGIVALLAAGATAVIYWQAQSRDMSQRWQTDNFPSVTIAVIPDKNDDRREVAELVRQQLLIQIGRYHGIKVYYDGPANASYEIDVKLHRSGTDLTGNTFVVDQRNKRLIWSGSDVIRVNPDKTLPSENAYISQIAFIIAHGAGVIHNAERQRNYRADTPYGCWLRFAMQIQDNHFTNDAALGTCAEQWYKAAPDHHIAAGLYAWTLLDQSIVAISNSHREALVEQAIETIERARAINPDSGFLPAIAVRTYAIANQDSAMGLAADQALKLNPGNLDVQGLVGTMLTLRSDPRGEKLLDDAIARRSNPPPWYFIAKFVAAMMREDTAGAHHALEQMRHFDHSLPVVPILTAAYAARTGQIEQARTNWERAKRMRPILRLNPDILLGRTPLDARSIACLKAWLAPVLR